MVGRSFTLGLMLGLLAYAVLGLSPLSAVQAASLAASPDHRMQQPVFSGRRAGARKAVPVTRGQDLGLRFRPDENESPYGQPAAPQAGQPPGTYQADEQSQFRPTRRKRKPTYEELQAQGMAAEPVTVPMPVMPYPMMPAPPLPGYGAYWPNW